MLIVVSVNGKSVGTMEVEEDVLQDSGEVLNLVWEQPFAELIPFSGEWLDVREGEGRIGATAKDRDGGDPVRVVLTW